MSPRAARGRAMPSGPAARTARAKPAASSSPGPTRWATACRWSSPGAATTTAPTSSPRRSCRSS